MESIHQTISPEKTLQYPQDVFDRIKAVKGDTKEKLHEANAILVEIRQRPKEDMSQERYRLEEATLKLIEYCDLELKQEEIDLDLAKRNTELLRLGVMIPRLKEAVAVNDDDIDQRYKVGDNQAVA